MITAENISDTTTDVLNGLLGFDFVFGSVLACPSSLYNIMKSSHRIKKTKQSRCATAAATMKGQVARSFHALRMYLPSKYVPSYSWVGGWGSSMQLILKCSLHMVYIEAGNSVNLRNHRNASHHSWQHTGILYISSSHRVKSARSHGKTRGYVVYSRNEISPVGVPQVDLGVSLPASFLSKLWLGDKLQKICNTFVLSESRVKSEHEKETESGL